jgi:ABC-2 type transport system ATP-binding protein
VTWAPSERFTNATLVGSRSGSPGGAMTATSWRTRFRTPLSPSGRDRRAFAATATSRRGCGGSRSGGQRRRVALAQALLGSPPVLILDEPTSGVDPEQRVTLRTVLAEIARTSIVVLSTHQTEDVAALCERVIVLDQGRVRYDGQVTELVRQAAGRVWLADQPDPAATVSWRTGTGRYRNVAAHARDGVEHVEPSLEDAYLLLRGELPDSKPAEEVAS